MGWSVCPHDDDGYCVLLRVDCQPAMQGCVLYNSVSRDELVGRTGKGTDEALAPSSPKRDLETEQ